jgi:hypothetical protein
MSPKGAPARSSAKAVLLASGAMERPFPIPGWTLPGVMGAGAAQIHVAGGSRAIVGAKASAVQGRLTVLAIAERLGRRIDARRRGTLLARRRILGGEGAAPQSRIPPSNAIAAPLM